MPAAGDHAKQRTEQARQQAATVEQYIEILVDKVRAAPDGLEGLKDRCKDQDVGAGNDE
jgi:hypothetical protein